MELTIQMQIKHNGKWYNPGDTITDLSEKDYKRLKEMKADIPNQGFKPVGGVEILDPTAPGGAKLRNRQEYVETKRIPDGTITETYKE
ncbi:hypothetical protein M4A92_15680 [Caldibacillus thermoamylovorans]|uniref:DUF7210 family protein n=1 Tax=Caldibacillus thermoamylovorans TaxID=35841 RepID=UPI00203BFCFF|nr:hypothetical protein [Caldibacillus thermoamylovorans]MCM3800035.1 hypothetical protein [Caldibacillus thermoamylovorans]